MKKAHREEEHENHERWLVSYADFITLLFAFFVVLYATSTQNEEKEKKFEESIREEFKMAAAPGKGTANQAYQVIPKASFDPFETFQQKRVDKRELEDSVSRLLRKSLSPEEQQRIIGDIRTDAMGVRIALAASAFFDSGSSKLKFGALKSLDKIGEILKKSPHKLMIEGHTDDQPIVGGPLTSNWELASLRASTVIRYFIKYHKMDPSKLAAISYADQKPLVPNTSEENRAKNRRIEILIVTNEDLDD